MSKRVTIKDIARELGISPSTVSRALNNKPGVDSEVRELVKKKAMEMGYLAFTHAKALKTRKTMTIGVIVSDIKNPFFLDFLDSVESVLFQRKYRILLSNSKEDIEREKIYIKWLVEHGVDGLIVSPSFGDNGKNNLSLLRKVKKLGIPIVLYDRIYVESPLEFDSVTIDNRGAVVQIVKYLSEMGHKKIGIVLADSRIYTIKERLEGFREGCLLYGLKCGEENILDIKYPFLANEQEKIMEFLKKDLTAVIATSHVSTRKIYECAMKIGRKIPDDLSIVGFDDVEDNLLYPSPITVVRQPVVQIGKTAAILLLSRLDGEHHPIQNVVLRADFVERESVKEINDFSKTSPLHRL